MKRQLLLVLLMAFNIAWSQNMRFGNLSTADGLSLNDVKNIFQDSQGFMWFGTRDGLNKYDGYNFTIYRNNPLDTSSISSNDIKGVCEDSNGNLWIATTGGLNRFDRNKGTFRRYTTDPHTANSPSTNSLTFIFLDKKENLIMGHHGGVIMFDPVKNYFSNYNFQNAKKEDIKFISFFLGSQNNLWMGGISEGLKLFNTKTKELTHFLNDPVSMSMVNYSINALYEDKHGHLWIGTSGNGLYRYDPVSREFLQYKHHDDNPNSLCHNDVISLSEDRHGSLWIGTRFGGLSILDKERKNFTNYKKDDTDPQSLCDNNIECIHEDRQGTIWMGTLHGGISIYDVNFNKIRHYKHSPDKNSLSNNVVKGFVEDKEGKIWFGTEGGGLNSFDPSTGHFEIFRHNDNDKNSISGDIVITPYQDRKGNLWLGIWKGGLNLFNPENGTFKIYKNNPKDPASLRTASVFSMIEDHDGQFWVGSTGGLELFDPVHQSFKYIPHPPAGDIDFSTFFYPFACLIEDSKGILWFKSDAGLHQYDKKTNQFKFFKQDPANPTHLSNNAVTGIVEDSRGNLWVGTENGLNLFNRSDLSFKRFGLKEGLPNAFITGILEDDKGNLWLTHNAGLSRFNPETLDIKNYGVSDGIQNNEFKRNSCFKASSGELYFGGINGFNVFHPDSLTGNQYVPPVYIMDFLLFNKSVPIGTADSPLQNHISLTKEIELSYEQSVFSFEYVALNFVQPQKNQYAYMLENFDKHWNEVGDQRKATYTNLDPGEYIFKVKASNNDGVWNEQGTSIKLIIKPPFWLTWWAKTLAVLFPIACFIAFYRIRIGVIKSQKRALEYQVKKRTEEISSQKNEIVEKNNEIMAQNEQLIEQQEELESQRNALGEHNKLIEEKNALLENQQLHLEHIVEKRTLELTNANKELIDKNTRLEQYGFVTSHNFRGPVATLLGLLNLYNKKDVTDPFNVTIVEKTEETTLKIDGMIADLTVLLDKEKNLEALFQPIHLETVVNNIKILLDHEIKESRSTIRYNFHQAVVVYGVPAYISSIFYNLISNAIKFRKENELLEIYITSRQEENFTYLSFEDNGRGIDIEKHKREIFHPFKKLNPHIPGKGLGLHLVKTQIEAMHGTIEIFSEEKQGTKFILAFPNNRKAQINGQ